MIRAPTCPYNIRSLSNLLKSSASDIMLKRLIVLGVNRICLVKRMIRGLFSSVQRALDIIALFDSNIQELGITEIAKALGLHKSTASGLVYTLQSNGYIEQNYENRKYRLGFQLLETRCYSLGANRNPQSSDART